MRQLVRAALPLGRGVILDPFMGSGSTIAAAEAIGYASIGVEKDPVYYAVAKKAVPALARFVPNGTNGKVRGALGTAKRLGVDSYQEGSGICREGNRGASRLVFGTGQCI